MGGNNSGRPGVHLIKDAIGFLLASRSVVRVVEFNQLLNRTVAPKHANLTAAKFRARSGITDCVLFCRVAGPVRSDARPLVTLPAALERPNFDNCHALLYGLRLVRDLSFHVEGVEAWAVWPAESQPAVASLPLSN